MNEAARMYLEMSKTHPLCENCGKCMACKICACEKIEAQVRE